MPQDIERIKAGIQQLRREQSAISDRIRRGEKLLEAKQKERNNLIYNPKIEESIYCRNDYAGFVAGEYTFYYGYEELEYHPLFANEKDEDNKKTWAFVVSKNGKPLYRKAIYYPHVEHNNLAGILAGIGYWLENKELTKREAKLVECLLVLAPHARISLNNVPAWQKGDEGIKFNKALKYVESLKELGINTNKGDV